MATGGTICSVTYMFPKYNVTSAKDLGLKLGCRPVRHLLHRGPSISGEKYGLFSFF